MLAWRAMTVVAVLVRVLLAQQEVSFPTEDEGTIHGSLYGKGDRAVVLAHGGRFTRESWDKQARALASLDFLVLSIDFRGEGLSRGGSSERSSDEQGRRFDILGATRYLRTIGARSVSVVGASMGGDYAAEAAEANPGQIDRIVLLASGAYTPLLKMKGRKLFLLARDDANSDGLRLPRIRAQYEKAVDPKEIILFDGAAHAQFLFETEQGDHVMKEIVRFLSAR